MERLKIGSFCVISSANIMTNISEKFFFVSFLKIDGSDSNFFNSLVVIEAEMLKVKYTYLHNPSFRSHILGKSDTLEKIS